MTRMFLAAVPDDEAVEHLSEFLAEAPVPRAHGRDELRWTRPEQWHVTLAFLPEVPEPRLEDLGERFAAAARERTPCSLQVAGAGAFPGPGRARVLYAGVRGVDPAQAAPLGTTVRARDPGGAGVPDGSEELAALARAARSAANGCGVRVDQQPFTAHLTLARTSRRRDVSGWVAALDPYAGPVWRWREVHLLASYPGRGSGGRARHESVAAWPLGGTRRRG